MLSKTYQPQEVEERLYALWEESGAFKPGGRPDAEPYTIVIPPPNVTGSLHIGHALNNTLQDILIRFERMRGKDTLWQPGMDHAGIATQLVVERQLAERQTSRLALGREGFIAKVWEWKAESGGAITRQLRRLGASCDWSRERFTMDEGLSRAVLKVFVQLHREGLIYKAKRLVNWDPRLQTAVSDLEVEPIEVKGHLWHLRYPLADGLTYKFPVAFDEDGAPTAFEDRDYIVVATTRPETMLGDAAVAVHPDDVRYRALVGKDVILPLANRRIPIVADSYADPTKGSGAVKITPAHDFNDFQVGERHGLPALNIMTEAAALNDAVPEAYRGLDRFEARKRIVEDLERTDLIDRIEPIVHAVPHDEKTKTIVLEPYLTEQWYLDAATLAGPALEAVRAGETRFVPQHFEKTYFHWLENIQPWCISRQLWWGHQIPAWYGPDGTVFVEETEAAAQSAAMKHYRREVTLTRDPDVLDTWFSSGLWPFSTLGWPDETPELKRHYQTDVLVTMYDIIFFWVARMMMFGTHFLKEVPFHTVLIHARVVDEKGQKMSKTKGNVADPLDLIKQYGADALRFALAVAAAPGKDLRIGPARVEVTRNFCTKLWNAARFLEMNGCARAEVFDPAALNDPVNQWIVDEVHGVRDSVTEALEAFRFNDAAGAIYHFVWDVYCDWYLEFIKPILAEDAAPAGAETRATASYVLDQVLALLHPFAPFITEELWQRTGETGPAREGLLIVAPWPSRRAPLYPAAKAELDWAIRLVSEVRSVRSIMNVPAGARIDLQMRGAGAETQSRLARHGEVIARLARLNPITLGEAVPKNAAQFVIDEASGILPLAGVIDMAAETSRLKKEIGKLEGELKKLDQKLGNPEFVAKAPEEIIAEQRERRDEAAAMRGKLSEALERLSA
ncbi:MAG: valine--tRNA ligase [Alphaproteobacteria bacterium]|nr:valine--tRNA ligase [Alphaproteobacteria bacterium]